MSDQQITCSECGDVFVFTDAEAAFYESKSLAAPPKRCKPCRQARKASGGRGGPDSGARGPRPGGFGGGGGGFGGGGGGGGYGGGGGNRYGGDSRQARGPGAGGGGGDRGAPRGRSRTPDTRGPRPSQPSEHRSPAFPEARWEPRRSDARGPASNGAGDRAPREARSPRAPGEPREPRARAEQPRAERPERPRFDITCGQCGVAAQVPFKPIEGRQVFCQECYRARRGVAKENVDAVELSDTDTGIVE